MRKKKYIFGYGSLVSPQDVRRTLGHEVDLVYPVELKGWIRDWGVTVDNASSHRRLKLATTGEAPQYVAALNIRRPLDGEQPTHPNGVLFEVTDADLKMIDARECHYRRQDVTADVTGWSDEGIIYAYTCLDQFLCSNNTDVPVIIPSSYCDIVSEGFASLGPDMYAKYLNTTLVSSLPIHDSVLL